MVEDDELIEQFEPRGNGLNVQIEVARVTEHRAAERPHVWRNQMPFEHLGHEQVRFQTTGNERPRVGVWPVLDIVGMEAHVQNAEGRIVEPRQHVPWSAPIPWKLREHGNRPLRNQVQQTSRMLARTTCQKMTCAVVVARNPGRNAGEEQRIRIGKSLQRFGGVDRMSDQAKARPILPGVRRKTTRGG